MRMIKDILIGTFLLGIAVAVFLMPFIALGYIFSKLSCP